MRRPQPGRIFRREDSINPISMSGKTILAMYTRAPGLDLLGLAAQTAV